MADTVPTMKDWVPTINLMGEMVKYSTTYNLLLFAALAWFFREWINAPKPSCKCVQLTRNVVLIASFTSCVLAGYYNYNIFSELVDALASIQPNPISSTINDLRHKALDWLTASTVSIALLSLLHSIKDDVLHESKEKT